MKRIVVPLVLALALLTGCDTLGTSELRREVVVEAYLVAGDPLGDVRLTRTVSLEEAYDPEALGITEADVRIEMLSEDGLVEEEIRLAVVEGEPGVYRADPAPTVEPLRTYRLAVDVPETGERLSSVTVVPDTIRTLQVNRDTVVYRSTDPLIFTVSAPNYPGRQNVFILTTDALEPVVENLTPFARNSFEDGDASLTSLSQSVSPLLNEENFDVAPGGGRRVQYPWLALNFIGRNRVTLQSLDDNLYDFVRSQSVQQGGSTLPPGEIPNVLENVDGGRGVFGSYARTSFEVVVLGGEE